MSLSRTDTPHFWPAARIAEPAQPSPWRATLDRWLVRLRERADMARMTAREMRDAGVTPYDVGQECAKPFWRE